MTLYLFNIGMKFSIVNSILLLLLLRSSYATTKFIGVNPINIDDKTKVVVIIATAVFFK